MRRAVAVHARRYDYDRILFRCFLSSVFQLILVKRASGPHGYWRCHTQTTPGHPPNLAQTWPGLLPFKARLLAVVVIFKARQRGPGCVCRALEEQLVDEALAAPATMHDEIFEVFKPRQMPFQLRVAPPREGPHVAPREAVLRALDPLPLTGRSYHTVDQQQQAPCLRGHLVERPAQHFMDDLLRQLHILLGGLDVLEGLVSMPRRLYLALPLRKERDSADECQVLRMIAPRARHRVGEAQLRGKLVHHVQRSQQPLRVLMQPAQLVAVFAVQETGERL